MHLVKVHKRRKAGRSSNYSLRAYALEYQKKLIEKPTEAELAFIAILESLNIPYSFQEIFYVYTTFFIVDFYIRHMNIALEIDGDYHFTKKCRKADKKREKELGKFHDLKVWRFTNDEVLKSTDKIKEILKGAIRPIIETHIKESDRMKPFVVSPAKK